MLHCEGCRFVDHCIDTEMNLDDVLITVKPDIGETVDDFVKRCELIPAAFDSVKDLKKYSKHCLKFLHY